MKRNPTQSQHTRICCFSQGTHSPVTKNALAFRARSIDLYRSNAHVLQHLIWESEPAEDSCIVISSASPFLQRRSFPSLSLLSIAWAIPSHFSNMAAIKHCSLTKPLFPFTTSSPTLPLCYCPCCTMRMTIKKKQHASIRHAASDMRHWTCGIGYAASDMHAAIMSDCCPFSSSS